MLHLTLRLILRNKQGTKVYNIRLTVLIWHRVICRCTFAKFCFPSTSERTKEICFNGWSYHKFVNVVEWVPKKKQFFSKNQNFSL
jgi:hypothetical protein